RRLAAVLLEKGVRTLKMLPVEQLVRQSGRVARAEGSRTDVAACGVIHRVAGECRGREQHARKPGIQDPFRRESAGREQQRISRQERGDHKAGLSEHDPEQQSVHPRAIGGDELGEVLVDVKNKIDQGAHLASRVDSPIQRRYASLPSTIGTTTNSGTSYGWSSRTRSHSASVRSRVVLMMI